MAFHPDDQEPTTPVPKRKKSLFLPVAVIFFVVLAAAAGGWYFFLPEPVQMEPAIHPDSAPAEKLASPAEPDRRHSVPADKTSTSETEPADQSSPIAEQSVPVAKTEKSTLQQPCALLSEKLPLFFVHLDNQPYIEDFHLEQPVLPYFDLLIQKLLTNPPVVTRESDDLYTILTNMAHFFRIIGRRNILLIKSILDRERDKIEDITAELYQWTFVDHCTNEAIPIQAPLDQVYEYAGFFLNTMGGRSYLFRRDSRSRLLVNYYSILIVDQANKNNMNQYGLDVRELIPRLIEEIEATNQLIYKEDYIDKLYGLLEGYQE